MRKYLIILMSIIVYTNSYPQMFDNTSEEPVDITAGKSTYYWQIDKIILEKLDDQTANVVQGKKELSADTIIYDSETEIGYAYENVVFTDHEEGTVLTAGSGTYYTDTQKVVVWDDPVLKFEDGTVARSDRMTFFSDGDYVILKNNVIISNGEMTMEGEKATYFNDSGKFKILGQATTKQSNMILTAENIDVTSEDDKIISYTAEGNVVAENPEEGYKIYAGKLEYFEETGYTRITENPYINFYEQDIEVYANQIEQYKEKQKSNLLGDVIIIQQDQKAYSRWGEYYTDEDMIYLSGNPIMVSGDSQFTAHRIVLDIEAGEMSMVGGGTGFYNYTE